MINQFYVVGGKQKKAFNLPQQEYSRFGVGVVAAYSGNYEENGTVKVEYITPDELYAKKDGGSVVFKSGSISNNKIYLCTQTELLIYTLPDFELVHHISLPCFNDVHHVVESKTGNLLVAVTGLDMVVEINTDGKILREWDTLGRQTWQKFSRETDYRKVLTTKPHDSHPNFVFEHNDDVWVSRFEQKDAICLTNPNKRIDIGIERPHDGHVLGDKAFFTTVDGHVVIANLLTCTVERVIDLHKCECAGEATGWARGLKIIDEDHVLVGFSTLRVTNFRDNVRWVKKRFGLMRDESVTPTHIALYNVKEERLCWRKVLEEPKIDVVFSIL